MRSYLEEDFFFNILNLNTFLKFPFWGLFSAVFLAMDFANGLRERADWKRALPDSNALIE